MNSYYIGARFYDPDLGRFLQVDPAREYWNTYSYVGNNPVMGTDPTGNSSNFEFQLEVSATKYQRKLSTSEASRVKMQWRAMPKQLKIAVNASQARARKKYSGSYVPGDSVTPSRLTPQVGLPIWETYKPGDIREISLTMIGLQGIGGEGFVKKIQMKDGSDEWFFGGTLVAGTPGGSFAYNTGSIESLLAGVNGPGDFTRGDITGFSAAINDGQNEVIALIFRMSVKELSLGSVKQVSGVVFSLSV